MKLIDFDILNKISLLLKILNQFIYWLDISLEFDIQLDWLNQLNRKWIEWKEVHLIHSDSFIISISNIDWI